ncbi:hypothetical protein SeMB42_g01964 [Synchytrium endobioticum]|uniref:AAA+ ATPase domain-containing protein n=1 Tax=Synchytrium endobioticum TaxID=286115 RepID=A0A507DK97_9FUNG|nr:hypothetical protein SeMB42_g01964 [Synchytrium endobioticum]
MRSTISSRRLGSSVLGTTDKGVGARSHHSEQMSEKNRSASSNKRHSLGADLEHRILPLIAQYQSRIPATSIRSTAGTDVDAILSYIQKTNSSLARKEKRILRKAIESCMDSMSQEHKPVAGGAAYAGALYVASDDSEFDDDPNVVMMEVKDTNFLNRSLISVYNAKQAAGCSAGTSSTNTESIVVAVATPEHVAQPISKSIATESERPAQPPAVVTVDEPTTKSRSFASSRKRKRRQDATLTSASFKDGIESAIEKRLREKLTKTEKWPTPTTRLSDLGGIESHIEEVLQLIGMPLKYPGIYAHLGIQPPRGILLHGPPGTGKTMLARAIAGEAGIPFISISAPSVVSGMSGESEKKIREVFEEAKELAPCLLFIDEIDAITPKRETAQREMERRIVAQLLTCMDDLSLNDASNPVMIIGATNRPDSLDPALRRAGRFDREIMLGVPDEAARARILEKMCNKLRLSGDIDSRALAKLTPGYVGADIGALTAEAGMSAIRRIFKDLMHGDFTDMLVDVPGDKDDDAGRERNVCNGQEHEADGVMMPDLLETPLQSDTSNPKTMTSSESSIVNPITAFLSASATLPPSVMSSLSITMTDFTHALTKVQPSSKREGFATVPDVTWSDIGALDKVREELRMAVVEPVKHPDLFAKVGISNPMGVLLYGPPGCGKTLLAKAVANESCCNFISVKGPELLNKYVGESERAVRQVFARAQASSPCVVFFDELDALTPARSNDADSHSASRLVNTLLTELDGLHSRRNVYVLAATNRPDMIDPAMLRPGRLDKCLYVDVPLPSERSEILKTLTGKTPLSPEVNLEAVGLDARCDGFSGADLAALVREASVCALRQTLRSLNRSSLGGDSDEGLGNILVTRQHFEEALKKTMASVSKRDLRRYELLKVKFGSGTSGMDDQDGSGGSAGNGAGEVTKYMIAQKPASNKYLVTLETSFLLSCNTGLDLTM